MPDLQKSLAAVMLALVVASACTSTASDPADTSGGAASPDTASRSIACATPLEARQPNVPGQSPAFPGQTRACEDVSGVAFDVTVLATGLDHPWSVEPLPGGDLLITERPGRLRIVSATGEIGPPITGLPDVDARGQGGLLDVALSPSFATDRTIFWSFAEPRAGGNGTSVGRGVLSADRRSVEQVQVILRTMPTYDGRLHFGSRLAFGRDGTLFVTTGERSDLVTRPQAQQLDSHLGKTLRINADGSVPDDNPFVGQAGALPEIWTYGHRNVQAATFDPDGRLWEVEHGAQGGDELNLIETGGNYGWPVAAYGEEYSGDPIPGSEPTREGMIPPVYYWDPVIAPSGAQWYTGDAFPAWRGSLFVGSLKDRRLVRLTMANDRVAGEEHLLADRKQRVRDVKQGPDGALYIVTDEDNGELWRVAPRR